MGKGYPTDGLLDLIFEKCFIKIRDIGNEMKISIIEYDMYGMKFSFKKFDNFFLFLSSPWAKFALEKILP